ncbi:bifunctional pyr operon transcriptional regulator/uracil phosphoribosyltransferase PyrR [Fundidesulfovibrio agrisoli]|uniref:bifunctional pyr operon transcriptional regulator/uracil phosphoribosyltransferase PyrR n=1 Tax=Fundidesulfovibrio agrisoli TaxID=2922717 RepID=UPI003C2C9FAA
MKRQKIVMNGKEVARTLERLAFEILERHGECTELALIGIQRRGVELAQRLRKLLEARLNCELPLGKLDINLYRDDWTNLAHQPQINQTDIPFGIDGRKIILVDDVLYSGRTIRAALEAILDFGRPRKVELLVLVDRGHRELPIQADYMGKMLPTSREERVDVYVKEMDGEDRVRLASGEDSQ